MSKITSQFFLVFFVVLFWAKLIQANTPPTGYTKVTISASSPQERTLFSSDYPIDGVNLEENTFNMILNDEDLKHLQRSHLSEKILQNESLDTFFSIADFPSIMSVYHNYNEVKEKLEAVAAKYPYWCRVINLGKTIEGRDILGLEIKREDATSPLPTFLMVGNHHAREHLSVELPLKFIDHIFNELSYNIDLAYKLQSQAIVIIPMINPDGSEYDISNDYFHFWRKNRRMNDEKTFGVDLNRNYGYKWGEGGSSDNPKSETYRGTAPFSEPETNALKEYINTHPEITTILSLHTYSELILYPWGFQYDGVEGKDGEIFKTMATKMSEWNGYTPVQASGLYIVSGDTCDWAYGEKKIFCFTFELSPKNAGPYDGGFYPMPSEIESSFQKNINPMLYLFINSKNPREMVL